MRRGTCLGSTRRSSNALILVLTKHPEAVSKHRTLVAQQREQIALLLLCVQESGRWGARGHSAASAATSPPFARTTSDVRATVHSFLSQAESMGEICGGFLLAALAQARGISATLLAAGALIAVTGTMVARSRADRAPPPMMSGGGRPLPSML